MLYLFLNKNHIKLLSLKKTLIGQYDVNFFEKKFQLDLIENGAIKNTDVLASAIKEVVNGALVNPQKDRDVFLILPQSAFGFVRTEVPKDIKLSAIDSFVINKLKNALNIEVENYIYDCFTLESEKHKYLSLFSISQTNLQRYAEVFNLIDLNIQNILPETLAYFKLFEKTLRKDKLENILYASFEEDNLSAYLYDSFGLSEKEKWSIDLIKNKKIEEILKQKAIEYEKKGEKINRLILSGQKSESIRQDTFTKNVGMWTNPLKRIAPNFYQEYIKMLVSSSKKAFPLLNFDVCFGAFIFASENKKFSLFQKKSLKLGSFSKPSLKLKLPRISKEIIIFVLAFAVSFLFFIILSKTKLPFDFIKKEILPAKKIIPTPTTIPTPTPAIKRDELKIKILNGSGTKGKASEVKDILQDKNYQEILTGNADSFDYEDSPIKIKKSKMEVAEYIKNDLGNYLDSFNIEELEEDNPADVIIIIGQDFK